jgi:hypothetical protein
LNCSGRTVYGTPTTQGKSDFTVIATNATGDSAPVALSITINPAAGPGPSPRGYTQSVPALDPKAVLILALFTLLLDGVVVGRTEYGQRSH